MVSNGKLMGKGPHIVVLDAASVVQVVVVLVLLLAVGLPQVG
jgi:hypothetical protein